MSNGQRVAYTALNVRGYLEEMKMHCFTPIEPSGLGRHNRLSHARANLCVYVQIHNFLMTCDFCIVTKKQRNIIFAPFEATSHFSVA